MKLLTWFNKTSNNRLSYQTPHSKRLLYSFLITCFFVFVTGFYLDSFPSQIVQSHEQSEKAFFKDNDVNEKEIKLFLNTMHRYYPQSFQLKPGNIATVFIATQTVYTVQYDNTSQEVQTSKRYIKDRILYQLNKSGIQYQLIEKLGLWVIKWNGILYLPNI